MNSIERREMFPPYETVEEPLTLLLYLNGGSSRALRSSDTYRPLADYFRLSDRARTISRDELFHDSHSSSAWENRVQWVRRKLMDQGLLSASQHGVWQLSPEGIRAAERALRKLNPAQARRLTFGTTSGT